MFKWWWCGYITVKQIKSNKFILYLPSLSLGNEVQNSLEGCAAIFFADASIKKVLIKRREMLLLWWPLESHISKKYPLEILLNLSKGSVAVMAFIIKNFIIIWKWKKATDSLLKCLNWSFNIFAWNCQCYFFQFLDPNWNGFFQLTRQNFGPNSKFRQIHAENFTNLTTRFSQI